MTQYQKDIIACLPAKSSEVASKLKRSPHNIRVQMMQMFQDGLIDRIDHHDHKGYTYTPVRLKLCSICGHEKPVSAFGFPHTRTQCIACRQVIRKENEAARKVKSYAGNPHANAFQWREFIQPVRPVDRRSYDWRG